MRERVYLAGPDVFFPEPERRGEVLRAVCAEFGLQGVFPLDGDTAGEPRAPAIAAANEGLIRNCDAVLANLTPFRGPSADVGTAYEVGFARALGRPVFGYSHDRRCYEDRVIAAPHAPCDADGLLIERFGLSENLMIACGLHALFLPEAGPAPLPRDDLSLVRACARAIADHLRHAGAA